MFYLDEKMAYPQLIHDLSTSIGQINSSTIRNEWGVLQGVELQSETRISDQELANALGVSLITVITHRSD